MGLGGVATFRQGTRVSGGCGVTLQNLDGGAHIPTEPSPTGSARASAPWTAVQSAETPARSPLGCGSRTRTRRRWARHSLLWNWQMAVRASAAADCLGYRYRGRTAKAEECVAPTRFGFDCVDGRNGSHPCEQNGGSRRIWTYQHEVLFRWTGSSAIDFRDWRTALPCVARALFRSW